MGAHTRKIISRIHVVGVSARRLETLSNPYPTRRYNVTLLCTQFSYLDLATGRSEGATVTIRYSPKQRVLLSGSLGPYLSSYRRSAIVPEDIPHQILEDLLKVLDPYECQVVGAFTGPHLVPITVEASYTRTEESAPERDREPG